MTRQAHGKTTIYLACFHSEKPRSLAGYERQFRVVETANLNGEWPYDNGDDPSFWVARNGGPLTWGVCRQDVRNSIPDGSVVAFFSFTPTQNRQVLYRLCAVATVNDKVDVRAVYRQARFAAFRKRYINALIRRDGSDWCYDETDRPERLRHKDWLWRIADHAGMSQKKFNRKYEQIRRTGSIPSALLANRRPDLARNYVVFATGEPAAYVSPNPPAVATARKGQHEQWINKSLQRLTVGTAARHLKSGRDYLRVRNSSGRNVHRQIRFEMPAADALVWRERLIATLKEATARQKRGKSYARAAGQGKCG